MDWTDIAIHAGMAACITFVAAVFGLNPWLIAAGVTLAFGGREALQDRHRTGRWRNPLAWSIQKHFEWLGVAAAGYATSVLVTLVKAAF